MMRMDFLFISSRLVPDQHSLQSIVKLTNEKISQINIQRMRQLPYLGSIYENLPQVDEVRFRYQIR